MTSILVEHAQYTNAAGRPIVGGKLYVGTNGADPVATSGITTIYSDRALTVPLANPQTLGTDGRAANKVWVDGKYSLQVNSVVGAVETQEFQDLDAGLSGATIASLSVNNIIGNNTITGQTPAALTALTSGQQFVFTTTAANTAPVTLTIDTTGSRSVVKNNDQAILPAEFAASQVVIVAYNATNGNFEWVNHNNKVLSFYQGSDIAAATTTNIWSTSGNTVSITGTTGISSFGTAPNIGARRTLVFDGVVTLTNGLSLALPGAANYTTAAGDILEVYAETLTTFYVVIHRKSGLSAVLPVKRFASTGQAITAASLVTVAHGFGVPPDSIRLVLQCTSAEGGYATGARVDWSSAPSHFTATANNGAVVQYDLTNVTVRISSDGLRLYNATTGVVFSVTPANWQLYVETAVYI